VDKQATVRVLRHFAQLKGTRHPNYRLTYGGGQAVILDIENTSSQRGVGHLSMWQERHQAYGENVMELFDRPHKALAQQQVLHRMLERARLLQSTFRRKLAQNRRHPPPPDKNAGSGWTHVTPLSASAQHVQRRQEMEDWSALTVETPQASTCNFGTHHLPSNRAAIRVQLRFLQELRRSYLNHNHSTKLQIASFRSKHKLE